MGKENDVILEYLDVKEHFADLFNGTFVGRVWFGVGIVYRSKR